MSRPDHDQGGRDDAVVVPFPGVTAKDPTGTDRPGTAVAPAGEVLDAELVDEQECQQRKGVVVRPAGAVVRVLGGAARSPRTAAAARVGLRTGVVIGAGFASWMQRGYDAATLGVYRRSIAAAEAAGDRQALAEWTDRAEAVRKRRHQALMDLPRLVAGLGLAAGLGLVGLVVLLALVGLVGQLTDAGSFTGVFHGVFTAVRFAVAAAPVVVVVVLGVGPVLVLVAAWREGHRRVGIPQWLAAPAAGGDVMDRVPDEGTIVAALVHCGVPGFTKALKGGWRVRFRLPPTIDGKGWRCQIDLPPAAPVEEFVRRKPVLAHNLVRFPIEVWPTEPSPGVLDRWVAQSGALSGPVDPWPLLADLDNASTDYFAGVPVAVTIRGDVVRGRLFEANYVVGGMMGSGKSTLVITLILGAMLDPLVEIDVVVMADNADYDPMQPRLRSLVTGAGNDTMATCLALLQELYDDLLIRGQALREHDARAVTRELAQRDQRLRPRIMVIDECQNLFLGEQGKEAIEVTSKLMSTARKYAITLVFLTPEPSKDALPRKLITIASNKACFAIGDHQANDSVLGTGSFKAGISAVGLVPKTDEGPGDVGTFMARGFTAKPGLLRSFYPTQHDAHRVTHRAMQLRAQHGRPATAAIEPQTRDLLDDLDQVLGADPVPIAEVPALLRRLAPHWPGYRQLTGKQLVTQLAAVGVKVPATGNRYPLDPLTVRQTLTARATADLDDEDDRS